MELSGRSDHRQQPDGRPPRLGPHVQGSLSALPRHAGRGPALPERLRLPGPVGRGQRREGARLHQQARHRGVRDRRVRPPVQAARPDVCRAPDRAVDPPRLLDGLERPGRAAPAARPHGRGPAAAGDDPGRGRPGHRQRGDAGRPAGDARGRRQLLHVRQREQRPHLGLPRGVPPAGLDLQRPRHHALVPALRDRHLPDGDERGLRGPRGPGPDRPPAAGGPPGRGAAGLDDHALDAGRQRRCRGGRRPRVRPRSGRATTSSGSPRAPSDRRSGGRSRCSRRRPARCSRAGVHRPVRRPAGRQTAFAEAGYGHRVVAWDEVGEEEGTGIVHIAPGCGAEDYELGKSARTARLRPHRRGRPLLRRLRLAHRQGRPRGRRGGRVGPRAARASSTTSSRTPTATRTAGAAARRCCSASWTSGTSAWARSTTSRERR